MCGSPEQPVRGASATGPARRRPTRASASSGELVPVVDHHGRRRASTQSSSSAARLDRRGHDDVRGRARRARAPAAARARSRHRRPSPSALASSTSASALFALRAKKIADRPRARAPPRQLRGVARHRRRIDQVDRRAVRLDPAGDALGLRAELAPATAPGAPAARRCPHSRRGCSCRDAVARRARARGRRARPTTRRAQRSAVRVERARFSVSLPMTQSSVGRPIAASPAERAPSRADACAVGADLEPRRPGAIRACPSRTSRAEQAGRGRAAPGGGSTASTTTSTRLAVRRSAAPSAAPRSSSSPPRTCVRSTRPPRPGRAASRR